MLKLKNFSRFYGRKQILKNIDLNLNQNEILCILGPNGAGKTTLLEGILSHHRHKDSQIFFNNKEIKTIEEHYHFLENVSYLGHEPGLFLDLTLMENIFYFLDLYKYKRKVLSIEEIKELLKKTNLYHRKDDLVKNFSRGMKQRSGLIRCMISNPILLLLDEPLTSLDEFSKNFLLEFLSNFKKTGSCLIVTHNDDIFKNIADRFIYLEDGKIQEIQNK